MKIRHFIPALLAAALGFATGNETMPAPAPVKKTPQSRRNRWLADQAKLSRKKKAKRERYAFTRYGRAPAKFS